MYRSIFFLWIHININPISSISHMCMSYHNSKVERCPTQAIKASADLEFVFFAVLGFFLVGFFFFFSGMGVGGEWDKEEESLVLGNCSSFVCNYYLHCLLHKSSLSLGSVSFSMLLQVIILCIMDGKSFHQNFS